MRESAAAVNAALQAAYFIVGVRAAGLAAGPGDFGGQVFQAIRTARAEDDAGAVPRQFTRGGFADAAAGAGDGDDFSFDSGHGG